MATIKEILNEVLPESVYEKVVGHLDHPDSTDYSVRRASSILGEAFIWRDTKEGAGYWYQTTQLVRSLRNHD